MEQNQPEEWLLRLKAAVDKGYYKTEEAEGLQTIIPWAGKFCKDCPFWVSGTCKVLKRYQSATAHTCRYFDSANRGKAVHRMEHGAKPENEL